MAQHHHKTPHGVPCITMLFKSYNNDYISDTIVVRRTSKTTTAVPEADEPVHVGRETSPARNPASNIIHIRNLVRPFTANQLKELLRRTGTLKESEFWMDKIKSHCFAMVIFKNIKIRYLRSLFIVLIVVVKILLHLKDFICL